MSEAAKALSAAKVLSVNNEIALSNGIVLRIKPMPPLLLNDIANSIPEPEMPKIFIEEDNRYEDNPDHPAYIKALNDRANEVGIRTINAIISVGSEVVSIPDGVLRPEDNGWLKRTKFTNYQFDADDPEERYLAWLRFYAIATSEDLNKVNTLPLILAGLREAEVEDALQSFRSGEERGIDPNLPNPDDNKNGDNLPASRPRGRPRNRGA